MTPVLQSRLLVGAFWLLGMPLLLGGLAVLLRVLPAAAAPVLALWAGMALAGLAIVIVSLTTLLRLDARSGGARAYRRWLSRYYLEVLGAFLVYVALAVAAEVLAPRVAPPARLLVSLAPTLGLVLMMSAVVRWVRRADEYHRARLLESFSVTAGITLLWTSGYAWLQAAGLPPLSLLWVPVAMTGIWVLWSTGRAALAAGAR